MSTIRTPIGLYVHIPFCTAKCHFCDFATFVGQEKFIDRYLEALTVEMQSHRGQPIDTLFIGGGTPSALSSEQIQNLFLALKEHFNFSSLIEATTELNPESATEDILSAFMEGGINRLSFGLQSSHDHHLKGLSRSHDWDCFLSSFRLARKLSFTNINIDLMYGLPNQTLEEWSQTLQEIIQLNPDHISAYALKVELGTKFNAMHVQIDDDLEADMYLLAAERLKQAGYLHYEISNFSRPGFESMHNMKYWKNHEALGLGVSSASFINGTRYTNTSSLIKYIERVGTQEHIEQRVSLSPRALANETIMLALRMSKGIPECDISALSAPVVERFFKSNLACVSHGRFALTPKGWLLSNLIFKDLV